MCKSTTLLVVFKILNGIISGSLLVLGIYVSDLLSAHSKTTTSTRTAVAAALQVASLAVKVLGYTKCARESSCARNALSVIKGLLDLASLLVAMFTGSSSSTFLVNIHLPSLILIVPGAAAIAFNALGWFGLLHNCYSLLTFSGIFMLILVPLEVIGLVIVYSTNAVRSTLAHSATLCASASGVQQAWSYVQTNFDCFDVLQEFLRRYAYIIAIVAFIVLLIQVCVGVFSIIVSRSAKKENPRRCLS